MNSNRITVQVLKTTHNTLKVLCAQRRVTLLSAADEAFGDLAKKWRGQGKRVTTATKNKS